MTTSAKINTAIALIVIVVTAMALYFILHSGAGDGSGGSGKTPGGDGGNGLFNGNKLMGMFGKKADNGQQTAPAPAPAQTALVSANYMTGYNDGQTDARGGTAGTPPAPDGTNDYIDGYNLGYQSISPYPTA